jgi:hypothetical protein
MTPSWVWAFAVACASALPFLPGFTGARVFYIRDLSLFFWGRYLWLRRTLLSGEWPLWDPYVGGGQSAVADALHQMFLLPSLLVRLVGSEVLGFNLWVALPFPVAAVGAWAFFARRFSAPAAALGAMAFAISGPVVSTANFPNMSWSVAAVPWVLWAVDGVTFAPAPWRLAVLALVVGFQAFAGEPVTFVATLALALSFAIVVGAPVSDRAVRDRLRHAAWVSIGIALGLGLAAIQIVPMTEAATLSERSVSILRDFWSLHPLAMLETVSLHLFGDYYKVQSLAFVPWMPFVHGGREPFFFSVYFGVPLLALVCFGLVSGPRHWTLFWVVAGAIAFIGALGANTPIYPFVRDHLPVLGSFRFPAKYFVIVSIAVAAAAAAGWNAIAVDNAAGDVRHRKLARLTAIGVALAIGVVAYLVAAACMYFPMPTGLQFVAFARSVELREPFAAAEFMLKTLPRGATWVALLSFAAAALMFLTTRSGRQAVLAQRGLYVFIVGDLLVHAWGINPVFDPAHLAEPRWIVRTTADSDWRFYVGGKREGTLDPNDPDSSRAFLNPAGLLGSASRAALSSQAAFYPSAWRRREMLSYDLPVLWPREFQVMTDRFIAASREERDRFLDRTAVRYRILPSWLAGGRTPIMQIPYFLESFLFDWGEDVTRRVAVVSDVRIIGDVRQQIDALFQSGWDNRTTAIVAHEPTAAGEVGVPVPPAATLIDDSANRVVVEAGAGVGGGYLVLLDSYSDDWHVTVDGRPGTIVRANGLFRAVRLVPGRHQVEFIYRPRAFMMGAVASAAALVLVLGLLLVRKRS